VGVSVAWSIISLGRCGDRATGALSIVLVDLTLTGKA